MPGLFPTEVEVAETLRHMVSTDTSLAPADDTLIPSQLAVKTYIDNELFDLKNFFNGTFVESFDALVTSNGTVITLTLEKAGTGDLTMRFSDGDENLDCTPKLTLVIAEGADAIPVARYIYILKSDKVLTVGAGWPTGVEHIKVCFLFVQTAATMQSQGGPYVIQNWNDERMDTNKQGHLAHIMERERRSGAIWVSGCEGVATVDTADTPDSIWVSVATGVVSQMHRHDFLALDSDTAGANDEILVINDNAAAYTEIDGLHEITADSTGAALGVNKYFSVVLWAVANKSGDVSPMLINLPSGQYNSLAGAQGDAAQYTNFTIPAEYSLESSTGFLIAQFIILKGSTNYSVAETIDLRGRVTSVTGGGTGGVGDVNAALVLTDNAVVRGDGGAKGVQDSGVLIDDSDNMSAVNDLDMTGDLDLSSGEVTATLNQDALSSFIFSNPNTGVSARASVIVTADSGSAFIQAVSTANTAVAAWAGHAVLIATAPMFVGPFQASKDLFLQAGGVGTKRVTIAASGGQVTVHNDLVVDGELEGAPLLINFGRAALLTLNTGNTSEYLGAAQGVDMTATKGFVMEKAGSFVGFAMNYDVTALTGSVGIDFDVEINGTSIKTVSLSSTVANDKTARSTQARNTSGDTFSAGDVLSLKITGSGITGSDSITLDEMMGTIRIYYDD